ncbi:hypothetical protein OG705_29030 [Streptomyces sp. NBC_00838]|uniref:hypothetical protein n=1 Tax=Streptomyces sp. NBC_00838 TaxID=2903680 RepID=UPI00386B44A9|nr:hypothetical protein OG705_29030 [Streptomyces sp. NBC_00838]
MSAPLAEILGPSLAALLTTPQQQHEARHLFTLVAQTEGGDIARAWLIGENPHLGDQAPINAIIRGHGADAHHAALAYLEQ